MIINLNFNNKLLFCKKIHLKSRSIKCNQLTNVTFKGANDYDKHKFYFNTEKEIFINT